MNNDPNTPNLQSAQSQQPQTQPQPVMQQQPVYGQPMNQPYTQPMQPGYGQPMAQPVQPVQKPPMDPKKKKAIITWCCIGGGVLVLGIVAAIILPILLRVDYSEAYNLAKDLRSDIYEIYQNYDCGYAVDRVNSTYTTAKDYSEYVEGCQNVFGSDLSVTISKLGETAGVKRNEEIKAKYNSFKTAFDAIAPNSEDLNKKLSAYTSWHNFVLAVDDLSYSSSTDAEFTAAAKFLIDSNNDNLKTYGEGWLERSLVVAGAYRAYDNASYSDSNKSSLRTTYNDKLSELRDWVSTNKPDITSLITLDFDNNINKMYSEFQKLYDEIKVTYEENYNAGSDDCLEFLGEVVCD